MITTLHHQHGLKRDRPAVNIHPVLLLLLPVLLLTHSLPYWIYSFDPTTALPDAGIWSLLLIAFTIFLFILLLCWYLFTRSWNRLKLPESKILLSNFRKLELWQQFILYWASFALMVLAAVGCLVAVM